MEQENLRFKREILGVAIILILGSLLIVYPFLDAIILAVATSYLLRFAHRRLNSYLENDFLSSLVVTTSVIGIFALGVFFFINNFYDIIFAVNVFALDLQTNVSHLLDVLHFPNTFRTEMMQFITSMSNGLQVWLKSTLASIPRLFIDLGIFLVTSIYLYRDGAYIEKKVFEVIESMPENEEKILRSLIRSIDNIFRGVFLTQFTVALILGITAFVGFYLIALSTTGIPFILLWSLLIAIAALMPLFAAFMIYGPIGLYYLLFGEPIKGTLILLFGTIVLNILPEILLRPWVGSKQMNEHPLIIFTGFIAGPLTLGVKGLVLGPIMLILSKEFILNYSELVSSEEE
ncbi:MAG: AI-2E family transporter [Candidatus Nanohaloarchaea archaeon]